MKKKIHEPKRGCNQRYVYRVLIQTFVIFIFFYRLSDWVEILWGFTKFFFKLILKVSAFYLEKQKSFIPKKNIFKPLSISKQKKLCLPTQFSRRFRVKHYRILQKITKLVQRFQKYSRLRCLLPKPSLKIRTANAIFWIYLGGTA